MTGTATAGRSHKTRVDIQALRGFAVLAVVLYHADIGVFAAGYLGVDVFFVISGFLISRLIRDGIEQRSFRFSDFYLRRAKRLLPAAYVTLAVTVLLSPLFLATAEMRDFRDQVVGAVTFTANVVLWRQSGYFGGAAELKPLLHFWSLAIEEQYYFFLPAIMVFMPRRFWTRGAALVLGGSLTICLLRAGHESTFYLLPTRAWELALGSFGTLMARGPALDRLLVIFFWPALATMVALSMVQFGQYHPGWDAVFICVATLVVIMRAHPVLSIGPAIRGFSWVGDMSYSLYLVHWPLFAFLHNVWVAAPSKVPPTAIRIGLIGLSFVLAYLLHRYIEEPARRMELARYRIVVARLAAAGFGLVLAVTGISHATEGTRNFADVRQTNFGFGVACEFDEKFRPIRECRNSERPEMLVWGDSFAMHLVPGLAGYVSGPPPMIQATRSECGPLLGVAEIREGSYDRAWAESCIAFSQSVVDYLGAANSIRTVVLSSRFEQYVRTGGQLLERDAKDGTFHMTRTGQAEAIGSLARTVDAIRRLGKRVVVVAPPPSGGFDAGRCVERLIRRLPTLGGNEDCVISLEDYRAKNRNVLDLLVALPAKARVAVISFDPYLCDSVSCRTHVDGELIYRDEQHLSIEGSIFLANAASLVTKIGELAK